MFYAIILAKEVPANARVSTHENHKERERSKLFQQGRCISPRFCRIDILMAPKFWNP